MECKNHSGVMAVERCDGCAEPFCANCLVEIQGQRFCGACKVMAVRGPPPVAARGTTLCTEARDALTISILGAFCCAFLQIWALIKAQEAKRMIAADPTLTGGGMVTAAKVIAIANVALFVLNLIAAAAMNQM